MLIGMQKSCINYYLQYHTVNINNIHLIVLLMYVKVSNCFGFPSPNLPVLHFYSQVKTEFPSWSFPVAPCLTPLKNKYYVSFFLFYHSLKVFMTLVSVYLLPSFICCLPSVYVLTRINAPGLTYDVDSCEISRFTKAYTVLKIKCVTSILHSLRHTK